MPLLLLRSEDIRIEAIISLAAIPIFMYVHVCCEVKCKRDVCRHLAVELFGVLFASLVTGQ